MNTIPAPSAAASVARRPALTKTQPSSPAARYLYTGVAALLFALMLVGFQQFYLHGRGYPGQPLFPPVKHVVIAHGVTMTAWMVLFLVQPLLVAIGHRRLHRILGFAGALLAVAVVVFGLWTTIATARLSPEVVLWGLDRQHFMAIPFFSIVTFGVFVAIGVAFRRRPEIHRPMMLLATLSVIAAATDRITGLPNLWAATIWGTLFGPYFLALLIGVVFLAAKGALTRAFDRWLAGGLIALIALSAFVMKIAPTAAWECVARFLTS